MLLNKSLSLKKHNKLLPTYNFFALSTTANVSESKAASTTLCFSAPVSSYGCPAKSDQDTELHGLYMSRHFIPQTAQSLITTQSADTVFELVESWVWREV